MKKNGKINLLQLVNGFAVGGAEMKLLELVENLNKDRFRITVCSIGHGGLLQKDFENLGIKVIVLPAKRAIDIDLLLKVKHLMQQEQIHIVQSTLMYADIIGRIASKLAKVPVTISWETVSHGPEDVLRVTPLHKISYRIVMSHIDKIVAVSDKVKTSIIQYSKINPDKVLTIPYGVDLDKFTDKPGTNKRKELGLSTDDTVIGVVARLEPWKGFDYLLPAAFEVIDHFPSVKFVFVGDGSMREGIEKDIKQKGYESSFKLLGIRNDVCEIVPAFDIFCLPSIIEGLPNVVLEAMACSKPVVATHVGGIPEAVSQNKTGLLVPEKDPNSLKNAFFDLLENRSKIYQMGKAGRKRVEKYFSLESEIQNFQKLYLDELQLKGIKLN